MCRLRRMKKLSGNAGISLGILRGTRKLGCLSGCQIKRSTLCSRSAGTRRSYAPAQGVTWLCGDARDAQLREAIGMQDVVFFNRFLCHMNPAVAGSCLCNIGELVKPGGYLFVSGVDLDVRAKVGLRKAWKPVELLMRETHGGDHSLRDGWPLEYWGLEPFDDHRADWKTRYASIFQLDMRP